MNFDFEKFKEYTSAASEEDARALLVFQSHEEIGDLRKYIIENTIGYSGFGIDFNNDLQVGVFWCTAADEIWGRNICGGCSTFYPMMEFSDLPSFNSSEKELLSFLSK